MSSSKGAIVNLVSRGVQDSILIGEMSLFRQRFSKHTNFSQAPVKITGQGNTSDMTYKLTGCGDLINDMWLEVPFPAGGTESEYDLTAKLVDAEFTLVIGGQIIDRQKYKWMSGIDCVYLAETQAQYDGGRNLAEGAPGTKNLIPLRFFFCRKDGFLPLLSLPYHEVEVRVSWGSTYTNSPPASTPTMYVNSIYLDKTEREIFTKSGFDMLVTQVQRLDIGTIADGSSSQIDLSYLNHPVKSLFFGYCLTGPVDTAGATHDRFWFKGASMYLNGTPLFEKMSPEYFGYYQPLRHSPYSDPGIELGEGPNKTRYYAYTFSIGEMGSLTPSGHCNFSRLDTAELKLDTLNMGTAAGAATIEVYALNYNVLKFSGGMAGILYGN